MAIDFLIFILLLLSFLINLLALGAFGATPGLRTMANRFVMNLLVMNLFGCLVLAPTLFLTTSTVVTEDITNIKITRNETPEVLGGDWNSTEMVRKTFLNCNITGCAEIIVAKDPSGESLLITSVDVRNVTGGGDSFLAADERKVRWWSLDLAAALGALSVLLVVFDTWCAITDPLRYHDRVSPVRSWLLIAVAWFLSILCGALSALRDNVFVDKINEGDFEFTTKEADSFGGAFELYEGSHFGSGASDVNGLFNTIFSSAYFVLVILLPFLLVCGMYWRIFSEAKENGHRIRQNGSSPLLQSALNLSGVVPTQNGGGGQQVQQALETGGISLSKTLTSKIPDQGTTLHRDGDRNELGLIEADQFDQNQNVILTLTVANDEIKRNMSAKQLSLLIDEEMGQSRSASKNIRHVHSTPNMQKSENVNMLMSTGIDHSYATLQLPTFQASPKALSYMTSIRHRLSNASSLFKYREESRAARISTLVVIMFAISYLPYGVLVILQSGFSHYFDGSTQILFLMILIGNLSSPFIFAYRSKRLQRAMKKMLGVGARARSQLNNNGGVFPSTSRKNNANRRTSKSSSGSSISAHKVLVKRTITNKSFLIGVEKREFPDNKCNFQSNIAADGSLSGSTRSTGLKSICERSKTLYCGRNICSTSDSDVIDL